MEYIGCRVKSNEDYGTIKYRGKLLHETKDKRINVNDDWFGIEWDLSHRGKNNGVISNVEYIKQSKDINKFYSSMIKKNKFELGESFILSFLNRYLLKEEYEEISSNKENLKNILLAYLENNQKINDNMKEGINTEFDDDGYIFTKKNKIKKVEYLGFDKIWGKIKQFDKIQNICLNEALVSNFGEINLISTIFKNLKFLSLENNLLSNWEQICHLSTELPNVELINLSGNNLLLPEETNSLQNNYNKLLKNDLIDLKLENNSFPKEIVTDQITKQSILNDENIIFKKLRVLIIINTNTNCYKFNKIKFLFPNIEELLISKNDFNDFDNLKLNKDDLKKLRILNLSSNSIKDTSKLKIFSNLKLEKLALNDNNITKIDKSLIFEHLKFLNLEHNLIDNLEDFFSISWLENLESIRYLHNPVLTTIGSSNCRMYVIGQNKNLKLINGSEAKRFERKDSEIHYLKFTFHDFFKKFNCNHNDYDWNKYLEYSSNYYPRVKELIKLLGNPYEIVNEKNNENYRALYEWENKPADNKNLNFNSHFCLISFKSENENFGNFKKRFPLSTDLGYIKIYISNIKKIKKKNTIKFKIKPDNLDAVLEVDDFKKKLIDYSDMNFCDFLVDYEA